MRSKFGSFRGILLMKVLAILWASNFETGAGMQIVYCSNIHGTNLIRRIEL